MAAEPSEKRKSVEQIVFCAVGLVVFAVAWQTSRGYPDLVRWFPSGVIVLAMVLFVAKIGLEVTRLRRRYSAKTPSAEG